MAKKINEKTAYINTLAEEAKFDSSKLATLYDLHIKQIYSFFYYRSNRNQHIAEDLTSQTFEKIVKNILNFDSRKASFATWLYTIAQNTLTDHYRKQKGLDDISIEQDTSINEENTTTLSRSLKVNTENDGNEIKAMQDRNLDTLNQALSQLSEKEQKVIMLRYNQDLSYAEIASITNESTSNIGVIISRTLKKIFKILEEQDLIKNIDLE